MRAQIKPTVFEAVIVIATQWEGELQIIVMQKRVGDSLVPH